MSRGLLMAVTTWGAAANAPNVLLATTHLESWIGPEANGEVLANRRSQLAEAGEKVARRAAEAQCCLAVLAGDMNWNDADGGDPLDVLRATAGGGGWMDAWQAVGSPQESRATMGWNLRLDRCFYLCPPPTTGSSAPQVQPTAVSLVGKSQPPSLHGRTVETRSGKRQKLLPSDHRGLLVSFAPRRAGAGWAAELD